VSIESALCNFLLGLVINSDFQLDVSPIQFSRYLHIYIACFPQPTLVWRRLALQYQHILGLYIAEKHKYCATILSQRLRVYLCSASSFFKPLLPSKIAKSREIPTKFDLVAVQGHRSLCQSKAHVRLPISNFGRTVFEILTHKARKWLILPPHPCLAPRSGEPIRISRWNLPQKTRGMELYRMVKISWSNLQPFLYESPVCQTDRRTWDSIARVACYAVAR